MSPTSWTNSLFAKKYKTEDCQIKEVRLPDKKDNLTMFTSISFVALRNFLTKTK